MIFVLIAVLLLFSAILSASENAFFSLGPNEMVELNNDHNLRSQTVLKILNEPDRFNAYRNLLALILLLNNFVNITIVILSSHVLNTIFNLSEHPVLAFLLQVVAITFMIVMLGEIIPKVYSTQNNLKIARFTSVPYYWLLKMLKPLIWALSRSTKLFDKLHNRQGFTASVEELNHAIDIAGVESNQDEKNILKGLVNYGNINVRQIMRNRMDIVAIESDTSLEELLKNVEDSGYSRLPVYDDTLDNIKGILNIKDLLPYIYDAREEHWHQLIRPAFFVPEFKKIDDLLNEFQEKRTHIAIVVDEYGGTQGLVTMEDVLEEIFGEIKDEFDEEELNYSQIDEHTYLFEGKMSLNDVCRIYSLDNQYFDDIRSESGTLGGLIMEIAKRIPQRGYSAQYEGFTFEVEAADKRRIKRVKTTFVPKVSDEEVD